jgi:phospholipid/cholesterol/gamma-HCH transport system permease protein
MKLRKEPLPIRAVEYVGEKVVVFSMGVGQLVMLILDMISRIPRLLRRPSLLIRQMDSIGLRSLPLVIFASLFTGAVSAAQAGYQMQDYAPASLIGAAVGKAVILELGPVLTALVVAGRVSTSIAAELGTMRVTEQIDALETMAIDPVWYLAAPRFFAGLLMMPVLVIASSIVAILGGYLVSNIMIDISTATFFNGVKMFFVLYDVVINQTKALIFGGIVTLSGIFFGYRAGGGAEGVGQATINAVVSAAVLILVFDYLIAEVML